MRNSQTLNLTSALLYTGGNHNLLGNWGREEELTIKRMEYTRKNTDLSGETCYADKMKHKP